MRPWRQFGVLAVGAAVLTGCSLLGEPAATAPSRPVSSTPAATSSPTGSETVSASPSTPLPEVDLSRFYDQEVEWKNCGNADCTTILVPLDYAEPEGRTVELAATRVRSTGDKVGSLFVNPGGPGGSAFDYAKAADAIVSPAIRESFDIVGVDPRGVAHSEPVSCLTDGQIDALMAADGTPDNPQEEAEIVADSALPGIGCKEKAGPVWAHMGTVDSARDLDIARSVVKDDTLSYLGKSYGTMLGATYAELFPDRVGRMVLDGVLPPDLDIVEVTKGQADAFEVAVRDFARDCVTHSDCPLSGSTSEAVAQLQDFLRGLDADPIPAGDRDLNEPLATYAVLTYLYFPQWDYPDLRSALRAAMEDRDPKPLLSLLDSRTSRSPDGRFTDNSTEAFYAVTCLDRPYVGTVDDVKVLADQWRETAPTFGPSLAWGLLPCRDWPASGDQVMEVTAAGSNPILVVSTMHDPATPHQWGERLDASLQNSALITWDDYNHTAYREGSACIDDAIDGYLLRGKLPKDGTVCG